MSEKKKSLEENEITTERVMGRRSTLGAIGATVLGAAALTLGAAAGQPKRAHAQSDTDSGPGADPAGRGRTGCSDSDGGGNADRGGHGRHCGGYTDSDSGSCADPGGRGRGPARNCSDSDGGGCADPAGRGRRC